jgi:hypothetical protein
LLVLHDVPGALVSALRRDADRLGVTTAELTVLLLSAATYRTAMPCRHDAQASWLNPLPAPDAYHHPNTSPYAVSSPKANRSPAPDGPDQPRAEDGDESDVTDQRVEGGDESDVTDQRVEGGDDCEASDEFEEVWIDDLPDAVLALKRPPG